MDLIEELNKHRHLKWGDPDRPDDDEAVVYLCAEAADELARAKTLLKAVEEGNIQRSEKGLRWCVYYADTGEMIGTYGSFTTACEAFLKGVE